MALELRGVTRFGRTLAVDAVDLGWSPAEAIVPGRRADLVRFRLVDGLPMVRAVWRLGQRVV